MTPTDANILAPFDAVARLYDETYEDNPITRHIRPIIWQSLLRHFKAGQHILELNCGTGTDAIMLAKAGVHVTAVDSSPVMIQEARRKVATEHLEDLISLRVMSFDEMDRMNGERFDGAFSNFGGLNCTPRLASVVQTLAGLVGPDGALVACVLNKICLWEMTSFLMRGRFSKAFRRLRSDGIEANLGNSTIQVWYYSPRQFSKILSPWFRTEGVYGLNILSPSPNSHEFTTEHPNLTQSLLTLDNRINSRFPFYGLGDHFVVEARRLDL